MTAERLTFDVVLMLRSPFLFQGLAGQLSGVDTAQLRDETGKPIIPGDQLRGVLREALRDISAGSSLLKETDIFGLFGDVSPKEDDAGAANEPNRARINFSDLTAVSMVLDPSAMAGHRHSVPLPLPGVSQETTRIEIDDVTGSAKPGALQVAELVAPMGAGVRFEGRIIAYAPSADAGKIGTWLARALDCVSSIGAFKSPGFGEIIGEQSSIKFKSAAPMALPAQAKGVGGPRRCRVTFDRPVLVDAERIAENAFLGSSVIPGAVFKGALARRLALAGLDPENGDLGKALAELGISHAFPESETLGLVIEPGIPLSMVAAKNTNGDLAFTDIFAFPRAKSELLGGEVPLFPGDWKGSWFGDAAGKLNRPSGDEPEACARTHTAIDKINETGTAEDQKLFTSIARAARRKNGSHNTWLFDIHPDLQGAAASASIKQQLVAALLEGLDGIGKTGATAVIKDFGAVPLAAAKPVAGRPDHYAVVLQTPALMFDSADVAKHNLTALEAYRQYWAAKLPGAELVDFAASQSLAGGYLSRRRRAYGRDRYHPFMLTMPGSVFLIKVSQPDALQKLCASRLPLPLPLPKHSAHDPLDWRNCPYMPENGYGQITASHLSDSAVIAKLRESGND